MTAIAMTTEAAVNFFLAIRPYYDLQYVRDLAAYTESEGIPFCRTCADWHFVNEEHSSTD